MKVIQQVEIEGKEAKLLLLSDNKTVQIMCDNDIVSTSAGETWKNIESETWAQLGLLKIEVENYIKKQQVLKELTTLAEEFF